MDSSLRPRSRPIKDQTEEMLRPKSRLDAQREKEKRQLQMKTFGDLEYRADLDKQLSWNPIARLGYNPDAHKVFKQRKPKTGLAFQGGGPRTIKKLKELGYEGAEKAQQGSVITTTNYSFSPVISHEFTHIGFDILKKRRNKDPEAFDKKYGEDAGRILKLTESGKLKEEYYIEFFDDLNTRFNTDMLPKDFKEFPKSTIRDTVQSYPSGPAVSIADRGEEKRNKRVAEIKKFQNVDLKRKEKGKESLYLDRIDKGILGLMDAAQDILTEQGEPPKAKMKTLSFWEKVGKSFSNLKPVGTRGLYEGGLSAQTEGAFNIDAEGRRRRRSSQSYLERSKEGTGQVVENVLGALPGIGTAMTVEEIQEELQKDDPNYGKIALLGGSELIGLIPGLGTAAKAGLRKVADQVGANKLAEILDSSPTVKPEREMFMGVKSKKAPGEQNILEAFERDEQDIRDRLGQTMKEELSQGKSPWVLDPRNTLEDAEFAVRETNLNKHLYPRTREAFEQEGYFLGRDKKLRFEISDKQANVQPYNIASFTEDEINNLPFTDSFAPQTWTQLDDVMDHPVLFENYPDLRDLPVIVDTDLAGKSTMGYFSHSDGGYIAISPDILKDSEQFRSTLLHEIMHSIQKKEGFEGGTTPSSLKVSKALDYERNLPEAKAAWKKYNADYADYKKAVDESLLELPDKMVSFIAEKIEKDTAGDISFQDIMGEISKGDQANFFGTFFSKAFEKINTDLLFTLDSINTLYYYKGGSKATRIGKKQKLDSDLDSYVGSISSIYRRLVPFVKSAEDVDLFQKTMGFAPEKANDTGIAELMRPDLKAPKTPSYVNPNSDGYLALLDRHKIYKRKMGEVEARNVQTRSDLTQEEIDALRIRGKGFKESEDTPPEMQWKDSDFNKGGTVMNRQMEMAFMKKGGLRDDGMNQDPVSGNEVPSGSMAKEVRDDIPAQLSEGEYVVPADVVRYYGVKFFEDLRTEAKIGLQNMEANGRIGGEPVPVGGPKAGENPLTPEEMEMLKQLGMSAGGSVRGFSRGGSVPDWVTPPPEGAMVTQVLTTLVNPITGETFTAPTGGYSINYNALQQAESPPKMADFDYFKSAPFQNSYERRPPGSTYFRTQAEIDADKGITPIIPGEDPIEPVPQPVEDEYSGLSGPTTMYHPNGSVETVNLPDQRERFNKLASEGYSNNPQVLNYDRDSGRSSAPSVSSTAWADKFDYSNPESIAKTNSDELKKPTPFGGAIGGVVKAGKAAQSAANYILAKARGANDDTLGAMKNEYETFVGSSRILGLLPDGLTNGDRLAKEVAIKRNIGLSRDAKDINGNPIFSSDVEYAQFNESREKAAQQRKNPEVSKVRQRLIDKYGEQEVKEDAVSKFFGPRKGSKKMVDVVLENEANMRGVSVAEYEKMSDYERSEALQHRSQGRGAELTDAIQGAGLSPKQFRQMSQADKNEIMKANPRLREAFSRHPDSRGHIFT